ncbi:hypothetical protein [Ornithinibacillus californiensis]|uniref:hypothetical protein n=1 Tax=Ornithinibacillus californiensis TaxID=161536 RepID=UPI0012EE5E7F|nr:hypothetical protein [Ornithinibacillus californiensis]
MRLFIWAVMLIMFFYTIGFSITLWKGNSKKGSIAVLFLALAIVITPFIAVLK